MGGGSGVGDSESRNGIFHTSMANAREPRNRVFYVQFSLPCGNDLVPNEIEFPEALRLTLSEQEKLAHIFTTAPHHAWQASALLRHLFPELIRRMKGATERDESGCVLGMEGWIICSCLLIWLGRSVHLVWEG